ncbi:hypothetical protein NDU88_002965 [Pleurodeles waltl]|uniref:Uncharacterized protein n=1 Tax=Pleurodeles waltl TaxID=8319 RepID=A0AAV7P9W0_PLEWA|nr:hypothetical protein NDU88_002965 [Pleurodeles waltl]
MRAEGTAKQQGAHSRVREKPHERDFTSREQLHLQPHLGSAAQRRLGTTLCWILASRLPLLPGGLRFPWAVVAGLRTWACLCRDPWPGGAAPGPRWVSHSFPPRNERPPGALAAI